MTMDLLRLRGLRGLLRLMFGALVFAMTGRTPPRSQAAMRRSYFRSRGKTNDAFLSFFNFVNTRRYISHFDPPTGILGIEANSQQVLASCEAIKATGYYNFGARLSPEDCEQLREFARSTPCAPRLDTPHDKRIYDSVDPVANIYDFDWQDLLENTAIQKIVTDPALLSVAQKYVGPSAQLQNVHMWWTNAKLRNVSDDAAAQLFHIDMDIIKWINFFIYLTDVDNQNGPHCFVTESHKHSNKPLKLWRDGRFTDDEISAFFPADQIVNLTGAAGTLLAVDTMGFHKGLSPIAGERLVLQVRFACSHFGKFHPKPTLDRNKMPILHDAIQRHGRAYADLMASH